MVAGLKAGLSAAAKGLGETGKAIDDFQNNTLTPTIKGLFAKNESAPENNTVVHGYKPKQGELPTIAEDKPHPFAHLNEKIASAGGCVTGLQCTAGLNQTHIQAQAGAGHNNQNLLVLVV